MIEYCDNMGGTNRTAITKQAKGLNKKEIKNKMLEKKQRLKGWIRKDVAKIVSDKTMRGTFADDYSIDTLVHAFYLFYVRLSRCKSTKYVRELVMKYRENPEIFIKETRLQSHEEEDMVYTKSKYLQDREFYLPDVFKEYYP